MTRSAFVIGHPVAHSRSPLIHGYWLHSYGIDGSYERFDIAPDRLEAFIADLRHNGYAGGNVTLPHKQAALALCDEVEDVARAIGAVNTLVVNGQRLFGFNTDWRGFLANLDDRARGWDRDPGPALVIGAGGSARAIVLGLSQRGFSPIRVLNRTAYRAEALAAELNPAVAAALSGHSLTQFDAFAGQSVLVVNTSTVGMNGSRFEGLDLKRLPSDALVTDIVYTPLMTPLLKDAAARGLATIDGLGMLLHQAVPGFESWFGIAPEVTPELRALVERDMGLV